MKRLITFLLLLPLFANAIITVFVCGFGSNRSVTITSCGTTTSFSNASIPAGSWLWIITSAAAGTVNEISIAITYTEN